jgi:hypothetical protein
MSVRRIAVLVGSHDRAYFARFTQPDRPSEAAVLSALRAQRSASEGSHRASAAQIPTDHGGCPRRMTVFAAAARTRRPTRHTRARILASRTAGA